MLTTVIFTLILVHLGALLSVAGVMKSADVSSFVTQLSAHDLVPRKLRHVVAFAVPTVEVSLGLWLLSGLAPRVALFCASAVLGAFLIYRGFMRIAGVEQQCGCFGAREAGADARAESVALTINFGLGLTAAVYFSSAPAMYSTAVTFLICGFAGTALAGMFLVANRRAKAHSRELAWALGQAREAAILEEVAT